jgi:immune inhibitor A
VVYKVTILAIRKAAMFLWLFFLCVAVIDAQQEAPLSPVDESRFPTYRLVLETEVPALDRYDLARRFLHREINLSQPSNPSERSIGEVNQLYISTTSSGEGRWVDALLVAIGEHVYIWLEAGVSASAETLNQIRNRFDHEVYEFVRGLWGEEALGIDGESRLHILISSQLPQAIGGYFASSNQFPLALVPFSNERDIIVMSDITLLPSYQNATISTAAHEFQHLIHQQRDTNEDVWLAEGFATLTEHLLGYGSSDYLLIAFTELPSTQLNSWGLTINRNPSYGATMLYNIYLYDRFGPETMQNLVNNDQNGFASISETTSTDADLIFADWVLANFLRQSSGRYGYSSLPKIPVMSLAAPPIYQLPISQERILNQYSTAYFQLMQPPNVLSISLSFTDTVTLFPAEAASGQWVWYSQRGDNSNSRLTHAFNLRNLRSARLDYRVWYALEDNWDYAYLSVSRDNGASWEIQTTGTMNDENRFGRAYGLGYTGQSGGWLDESISLDTYVGSEILVRFEMLSDDGVNFQGFVLDDIRLDALGYTSDFEVDGGGWQSEGWIRTDNRLPQRAWLQIIQHQDSDNLISRHLVEGEGQWTLNIDPETSLVSIALSPFAPMTTEPIEYELRLE